MSQNAEGSKTLGCYVYIGSDYRPHVPCSSPINLFSITPGILISDLQFCSAHYMTIHKFFDVSSWKRSSRQCLWRIGQTKEMSFQFLFEEGSWNLGPQWQRKGVQCTDVGHKAKHSWSGHSSNPRNIQQCVAHAPTTTVQATYIVMHAHIHMFLNLKVLQTTPYVNCFPPSKSQVLNCPLVCI